MGHFAVFSDPLVLLLHLYVVVNIPKPSTSTSMDTYLSVVFSVELSDSGVVLSTNRFRVTNPVLPD